MDPGNEGPELVREMRTGHRQQRSNGRHNRPKLRIQKRKGILAQV